MSGELNHGKAHKTMDRRYFVGGSDARIIMGDDEVALLRLWREKRGEIEPYDLSGNLIVQLGLATEDLNRRWYQANTGQVLTDIQRKIRHPVLRWMAATLDGRVPETGAVFGPSSCCRGRSQKRRLRKNTCRSCSTICG
jgi:predicted phage-related endonuclease